MSLEGEGEGGAKEIQFFKLCLWSVLITKFTKKNYFLEEKRSDFLSCHYSIENFLQHVYYTNVIANVNRTLLKLI